MAAVEEIHASQYCGKANNWNIVPVQNCGQVTKCLLSTEVYTTHCPQVRLLHDLDGHVTSHTLKVSNNSRLVAIPSVIMFICKSV